MRALTLGLVGVIGLTTSLAAQTWSADDPVLQRIWELASSDSHAPRTAQVLTDSLGPRLPGTPEMDRATDWAVGLMRGWGVDARKEQYGTWIGWERGPTHLDLIQPRVRTLEATMLAWSAGTNGPVEGEVTIVPDHSDEAQLEAWLATVAGKFVAISFPQPTCRPDSHYREFGTPGALERLTESRRAAREAFQRRVPSAAQLRIRLEAAGAAGILESFWSQDIGVNKIYSTNVGRAPTIDLSCEDYGLVWRLAENDQGPVLRLDARSAYAGEVPVHNVIGMIRGRELPDEYVILSAHFDSWDGASGATDNGTGSTVMLEALRILGEAYPDPRRTIMIGLWGGEEQGLNGSRRFAAAHPEIVDGLQVLLNVDEGTGRVVGVTGQGFVDAAPTMSGWLARLPAEITGGIELDFPGIPSTGTSDHAAFVCAGAPGFHFRSRSWSYDTHTWHTNRDTFDKIVFEEIRSNVALMAMLAYLASEDPERVPRTRRVMPPGPQGEPQPWPTCVPGASSAR